MKDILLIIVFGLCQVARSELCFELNYGMALFLHNDKSYKYVSLDQCKSYCEAETSFSCISFDYTSSRSCYLSRESHETDPAMFGKHAESTYGYVVPCDEETENGSGSGSGDGSGDGNVYGSYGYGARREMRASQVLAFRKQLAKRKLKDENRVVVDLKNILAEQKQKKRYTSH